MAGYRLIVDMATVPQAARRSVSRRILRIAKLHAPWKRRTGRLSGSTRIDLYEDLDLLVVKSEMPYASYLIEGTSRINGVDYLANAVKTVLPSARIVRSGRL